MAFNTDMADSEDDEVLIVDPDLCKCGKKHGTQASPNPRGTKDELMRLGMVLVDNSMRVYVERLFRPKTRRELDDKNAPADWFYLTELYNSEDFHPEMNFQDVHTTDIQCKHKLHPETVPEHTRSSKILKEWFTKLRQNLTMWNVNFEASGQNDPERMWDFVKSNKVQDYAVWHTLKDYNILDQMLRTLDADAQIDEGSGGPSTLAPPAQNKKRQRKSDTPPPRNTGNASAGDARDAVLLGAANYLASQAPQVPAPSADPTFQKAEDDSRLLLSIASSAGATQDTKDMANNYIMDLMRNRFRDRI